MRVERTHLGAACRYLICRVKIVQPSSLCLLNGRLFHQPCLSSLSKLIKPVQMKMEDVAPRARRVRRLGQLAHHALSPELTAPRAHMVGAASAIDCL